MEAMRVALTIRNIASISRHYGTCAPEIKLTVGIAPTFPEYKTGVLLLYYANNKVIQMVLELHLLIVSN